jgi:hypothetical protein
LRILRRVRLKKKSLFLWKGDTVQLVILNSHWGLNTVKNAKNVLLNMTTIVLGWVIYSLKIFKLLGNCVGEKNHKIFYWYLFF